MANGRKGGKRTGRGNAPVGPAAERDRHLPTVRKSYILMLREVLARPNDWPLSEDDVGYWIPRSALRQILAILEAKP